MLLCVAIYWGATGPIAGGTIVAQCAYIWTGGDIQLRSESITVTGDAAVAVAERGNVVTAAGTSARLIRTSGHYRTILRIVWCVQGVML